MRSFLFNMYFYAMTSIVAVTSTPLLLWPTRTPMMWLLHCWARAILWGMRKIMRIPIEVRGIDNMPEEGPWIIAPKHQSWADAIVMLAHVPDLTIVATKALEEYPLIGRICRKVGVILVDREGGRSTVENLNRAAAKALEEGRKILIYPEGELILPGKESTYKKGVSHLYEALALKVAPVATNLGLRWPQNQWRKYKGTAVIEFLKPIEPGLHREKFMARLRTVIESRTRELLAESIPGHPNPLFRAG